MVAALKSQRNGVGVEIEPEYRGMAASHLKAEGSNLFSEVELVFEKAFRENAVYVVKEDPAFYQIRPARRKLQ